MHKRCPMTNKKLIKKMNSFRRELFFTLKYVFM